MSKQPKTETRAPRVLMVLPQYPFPVVGGFEWQAHMLATELVAVGTFVQVISGKIFDTQADTETVEGVPVFRLPWSRRKAVRFALLPWRLARKLVQLRRSYDIVHVHQYSWFSLFVILLAKLLGKRVLTKMSNVGMEGIPGVRTKRWGNLQVRLLLMSDGIVAMSEDSVREVVDAGYPRARLLTVPNGVRLHSQKAIRAQNDVDCLVVFCGRLVAQKGIEGLLAAWQALMVSRQTGKSATARLELWGDGPLMSKLLALRDQLGLQETVTFRGHVANASQKIGAADIFVLPSRVEGNSNAVLEAMAAGLPIVSTRVGGTMMQVGPEGRQYLVDFGDVDGLMQRLQTLTADAALRADIGGAMRRRAENLFDIKHVAAVYRQAYLALSEARCESLHELSELPEAAALCKTDS